MRVCLDVTLGRPWYEAVKRPAIRHLTELQLAGAVGVAESMLADPASLPGLNAASLRMRGKRGPGAGG